MSNTYDVIVVGAGNGGLVTAAMTAKNGLKTLLLEKHNIPGGCASSFVRGRFEFEPSLHELCSVGTKEKPADIMNIFNDVGADVDWRYDYDCFRVIKTGEDGFDVVVHGGTEEAFAKSIDEAVPGSYDSVMKMFQIADINQKVLDSMTNSKSGMPNIPEMLFKYYDFVKSSTHSVEEIMNVVGVPKKAQEIMNTYWGYLGVPTDELNCMHYLSMVVSYVRNGAAMPFRRSHELSLAYCDTIYKNGGEIYYNSEVTDFIFENGVCCGVKVGDKEYRGKEIVSNIIPHNVYNMIDSKYVPKNARKYANARKFGMSLVTVYLGLDCTMEELNIKDYTTFVINDGNPRKQFDNLSNGGFYIVNCLNKPIPDCTPKGTCTLFFSLAMFEDEFPKDLKPETYKKWKNAYAEKFIKKYEDLMGVDIRSHIEEIEIATPVTFARYLNTPSGEVYGYHSSGWDNVMLRSVFENIDKKIPGLSYVGGHASMGDGYSSAYITGRNVSKAIIKKLKED